MNENSGSTTLYQEIDTKLEANIQLTELIELVAYNVWLRSSRTWERHRASADAVVKSSSKCPNGELLPCKAQALSASASHCERRLMNLYPSPTNLIFQKCKCFLQYMWSYCEIIHRNTSPITSLKFLYFNQATQRTLGQPGQLCSAPGFFQSKTEGWISVRFYVSNKCNWCNWFIINQQGNKAQTQVENKTKNQVMRCRAMSYVTCTTYFWSCLPLNHSTWPGPKEPGAIRTKRPRPSRFLFWY